VFLFPPHATSAFALPGGSRPSIIRVEINEKKKSYLF